MENKNLDNQINRNNISNKKFQSSYTYYIFLVCNFISMLGLAISLIFTTKNDPNNMDYKLPVIICNVISLAILTIFLYLESKIILSYRFHINHKWYKWFITSIVMFALILISSTIIVCLPIEWTKIWSIALFVSSIVLSLIVVGIYKYARFHIDKEIYLRKNGVQVQKNEEDKLKNKEQQVNKISDKEFKKMHDEINDTSSADYIGKKATSNLFDELDENEEHKKDF